MADKWVVGGNTRRAAGAGGGCAPSFIHCWVCGGRPPRPAHSPALLGAASGEAKAIRRGKKSQSLKESSAEMPSWKWTINHS